MKKKMFKIFIGAIIITLSFNISFVAAETFSTISFDYNCTFEQCLVRADPWPTGNVLLGGVPFNIPDVGNNVWNSSDPWGSGVNPRTLDIQTNEYGADNVYTLINTHGGQPNSVLSWLEFWGDGGAYYKKDLVGNVDIRDYNYDGWTNNINGTTTVNVFLVNPGVYNGESRLDMQRIDLPDQFLSQTLINIRLTDIGGNNIQRTFISGVTVATVVPEPISSILFLIGGATLIGKKYLRRKKIEV
jgi:hypothetical protein